MVPAMVALALQADGWFLRSDIIWHKKNPMPESCTDRPTTAHEHIFLLTKSSRYFYDAEAVKEGREGNTHSRGSKKTPPIESAGVGHKDWCAYMTKDGELTSRNLRTVWTIATAPFPQAHFATFPPAIPERCIKAGTSEWGCCPKCGAPWRRVVEKGTAPDLSAKGSRFDLGKTGINGQGRTQPGERFLNETTGWTPTCTHGLEPVPQTVLDIFSGAGTTALVAAKLGRDAIGIELNPAYVEMSRKRIAGEMGMLCEITSPSPLQTPP